MLQWISCAVHHIKGWFKKKRALETIGATETSIKDRDVWTGEKEPSIEQKVIQNEMNQCIRDFIENLLVNYKTVVILSELEGLKNQEIADILKISLDSVKIRLHRGRASPKKKLESNCSFYRNELNVLACDQKVRLKNLERLFNLTWTNKYS